MKTLRCLLGLLSVLTMTQGLCAQGLVCEGVLGNSGEQGPSLVRYGEGGGRSDYGGIGVACDRFGSLWDRAGKGTFNRYAADGRLLGQYVIPDDQPGWNRGSQIALAGDLLAIKIGSALYSLPITAPAGTSLKPLNLSADCISFAAVDGKIAVCTKGTLSLLDVRQGTMEKVSALPANAQCVEMTPDGAIYVVWDWKAHKFVRGQEVTEGWPKPVGGERPQFLDGHWYCHTWHGTIKRFDARLEPAPGVVFGGASGSFIGHLDQNSELQNGRGLAKVNEQLFAASGMGGVVQLLSWDGKKQQMTAVRRIGAVPACPALGLDAKGMVWWQQGAWKWEDLPDAPQQLGVNNPDEIGQAVMLDSDVMVAPAYLWGKPMLYCGRLSQEVSVREAPGLSKGMVASAVYRQQNDRVLLVVDAAGKAQSIKIGDDGLPQGNGTPVSLKTATPGKQWTSLAMKDAITLLAAVDGSVIELTWDGTQWQENKRWNSWGATPADRFGQSICIAVDGPALWVSDRDRHRVMGFDLKTAQPTASFGTVDKSGDSLTALDRPATLAARAGRLLVYDAGNQRLVKLSLR